MGRRLQAIATPHRGPTEQAILALAGPHAMPLEGRRSRLRRRSGSGAMLNCESGRASLQMWK